MLTFSLDLRNQESLFPYSKGFVLFCFPFESVVRYISWTEPVSNLVLFSTIHTSSKGFMLFRCALPSDGTLQES